LSAPILLDGGFTAWHLGATRAGATVAISWAPQHTVDVALLLSLLALVVVLGCIVVGARRRTRGPSDDPARTAVLAWPWRERAAPSLVAAAIATAVAMAIAGPAVALVVIPLLALAWWRPPLRAVLALAPAALVGLAALYVVERQRKYGWPHNIQWPAHFGAANTIAWIAVALLLVDVAAYGFGPSAAASRDAGDAGATAGRPRRRPRPRPRPGRRRRRRRRPRAAGSPGSSRRGCSARRRRCCGPPRTRTTTDPPASSSRCPPTGSPARLRCCARSVTSRTTRTSSTGRWRSTRCTG
jgi:hypothetical protein